MAGVFHSFRRLGNCLALLKLLESAAQSRAAVCLHQLPPKGTRAPLLSAAEAVSDAWGQVTAESDATRKRDLSKMERELKAAPACNDYLNCMR